MAKQTQIDKLMAQYDEFVIKIEKSITAYIVGLIKQDPHIKAISFVHDYDSYWNDDGYSVYGLSKEPRTLIYVDDMGVETRLDIDNECYGWSNEKGMYSKHPACPVIEEFAKFLSDVPENLIKLAFEEGQVFFYADGTYDVEEYCYQ